MKRDDYLALNFKIKGVGEPIGSSVMPIKPIETAPKN